MADGDTRDARMLLKKKVSPHVGSNLLGAGGIDHGWRVFDLGMGKHLARPIHVCLLYF